MSVIACVKVPDGIVLGAESMTQIYGSDPAGNIGIIKTYANAQKLYQLSNLSVGVMTYGLGNIGPRSIGSFISQFGNENAHIHKIGDIANELLAFLRNLHQEAFGKAPPEKQPKLGLYLGGYSPERVLAEEWEFVIPDAESPH